MIVTPSGGFQWHLKVVGYINKIDNPEGLQKIVRRQQLPLRQGRRDKANDITNNEQREITKFVDAKACEMAHVVFGEIKDDLKIGRKDSKASINRRGANFATSGNDGHPHNVNNKQPDSSIGSIVVTRLPTKRPFCNSHHVLVRC